MVDQNHLYNNGVLDDIIHIMLNSLDVNPPEMFPDRDVSQISQLCYKIEGEL